jgi:hypothetical protein
LILVNKIIFRQVFEELLSIDEAALVVLDRLKDVTKLQDIGAEYCFSWF